MFASLKQALFKCHKGAKVILFGKERRDLATILAVALAYPMEVFFCKLIMMRALLHPH